MKWTDRTLKSLHATTNKECLLTCVNMASLWVVVNKSCCILLSNPVGSTYCMNNTNGWLDATT